MNRYELILPGCTAAPLSNYLKAIGLIRLLATQTVDPTIKASWRNDQLVLHTTLTLDALCDFLLHRYQPTPIVSPWNGGSGFFYRENRQEEYDPVTGETVTSAVRDKPTTATAALDAMADAPARRFAAYRTSIGVARHALKQLQLVAAPSEQDKAQLILLLRNTLPDEALNWLDAAILLTSTKPMFPPLLGSGGNDGNLDFSTNFIQRLLDLFDAETGLPLSNTTPALREALSGEPSFNLRSKLAIGQFAPGAVGGPNATTGFDADSLINPWDYILLVEGAVLFAAATTRRLESGSASIASYPFTVYNIGSGAGSLSQRDEKDARGEMWLPLWEQPVSYPSLQAFLAEGRITLGQRTARDGLDVARAISSLGAERGVSAFVRYGFLGRSGKAYLATLLSRFEVQRNLQADLIADLDRYHWLSSLRRFARQSDTPERFRQLTARLENALFAMSQRRDPEPVQATLIALGALHRYLAQAPKGQKQLAPVAPLSPDWIIRADDGSHEYRLAASIASLENPPLNAFLYPLQRQNWQPASRCAVWGNGPLVSNLVAVLTRRLMEAKRTDAPDKPLSARLPADAGAVTAFISGAVDDSRLAALILGLALAQSPQELPDRTIAFHYIPRVYALLKPLFVPDRTLRYMQLLTSEQSLPIPPGLVNRLTADAVDDALVLAQRRLRGSGLAIRQHALPERGAISGDRLAAALLVPIQLALLRQLLARTMVTSQSRPSDLATTLE